jgi:hypothetical protein
VVLPHPYLPIGSQGKLDFAFTFHLIDIFHLIELHNRKEGRPGEKICTVVPDLGNRLAGITIFSFPHRWEPECPFVCAGECKRVDLTGFRCYKDIAGIPDTY